MNFGTNHTPDAVSIAWPVDLQPNVLPLWYGCPNTGKDQDVMEHDECIVRRERERESDGETNTSVTRLLTSSPAHYHCAMDAPHRDRETKKNKWKETVTMYASEISRPNSNAPKTNWWQEKRQSATANIQNNSLICSAYFLRLCEPLRNTDGNFVNASVTPSCQYLSCGQTLSLIRSLALILGWQPACKPILCIHQAPPLPPIAAPEP